MSAVSSDDGATRDTGPFRIFIVFAKNGQFISDSLEKLVKRGDFLVISEDLPTFKRVFDLSVDLKL